MEGFSEKEVEVVAVMLLDDYKKTLGANPDLMVKLAFDWLDDKDAKIKGAEKLAVYHDEIVMGGEDD
jgi:predicted nucleotidyltransferase